MTKHCRYYVIINGNVPPCSGANVCLILHLTTEPDKGYIMSACVCGMCAQILT